MKSIIQEASSIEKAIKQGIEKAGNPRDFAVKVLEYPEKNFFGMTTKPAKVAIYCEERTGRSTREPHVLPPSDEQRRPRAEQPRTTPRSLAPDARQDAHAPRRQQPPHRTEQRNEHRNDSRFESRNEHQERPSYTSERTERVHRTSAAPALQRRETSPQEEPVQPRWNDELIHHIEQWLTTVLASLHMPIPFTVRVDQACLHVTLEHPLFEDTSKERKVLSSLSLLLIETSKHTFKANLRGHRVLLSHRTT